MFQRFFFCLFVVNIKQLNGFAEKLNQEESQLTIHNKSQPSSDDTEDYDHEHSKHKPAMGVVQSFLLSLSNADRDGRILITIDSKCIHE